MVCCLSAGAVHAAADRFDYDPAGRLIRRIDDQSRGTDYVYDPAGNVLQVGAPGQALPPSITSGPLPDQRRNEVRQVSVGGSGLAGVSIKTSHPGIVVTGLVVTATAASFRLWVSNQVPLGRQEVVFQNSAGSVSLPFNVLPAVGFTFVPEPISVAPDNIARKFSLQLSEPFADAKTFGLATLSSGIAKPSAAQISFAPGQTQANLGIIGITQGTTLLRLYNTGLNEPVESLVYVGSGLADLMRLGTAVGVSRGLPTYLSPTSMASTSYVGISRAVPWYASPGAMANSSAVGISRGTPWYASSSATWNSTAIGIARGTPWYMSPDARSNSGTVGIVRGTPWYISATTNPLVAPLVGIARP